MKRAAFPQNIRFQLPLTYAGIAALAAILIGAMMILIIGNYYHIMELEYLAGNADGIARNLTGFASREKIGPENSLQKNGAFFQNQARATAFLIRVHPCLIRGSFLLAVRSACSPRLGASAGETLVSRKASC